MKLAMERMGVSCSPFALETTNRGLINPFTNKTATPQQSNDLLSFRSIGEQEFNQRIVSFTLKNLVLKCQIINVAFKPFLRRKLTKVESLNYIERYKQLIISTMRKKIQFLKRTGRPIEKPEQLLELPLALADSDGNPLNGQKSFTTRSLLSRYKTTSPTVFPHEFPWKPECCLLEGMF